MPIDQSLQDLFDKAALELNEATIALPPLDKLRDVSMWQWDELKELYEQLGNVIEQIDWALTHREQ